MKEEINNILKEYLKIFPNEKTRQEQFMNFLKDNDNLAIVDWNNFEGHIVTGCFIYAQKEKEFLMLYHKDLHKYLYPGGHVDKKDSSVFSAALREVTEETGLKDLQVLSLSSNPLIPIDIDTQFIAYNYRLSLPSHYHYDFRYVLMIKEKQDIIIDKNEHRDYKWVPFNKIINLKRYHNIKDKLLKALKKGDL